MTGFFDSHYHKALPFKFTEEEQLEMLAALTCPIVCRGYLDGNENWHQLCINRAKRALEIIREI